MINKKTIYIITTSLIAISLLYFFDQIIKVNYNTKILLKVLIFTIFPMLYIFKTKDNMIKYSLKNSKSFFTFKISIILGLLIFAFLVGVYAVLGKYIDISVMTKDFEEKYKITSNNFIYYGLYMSFINSLIEEFFFRGFIFLNLKKLGFKKTGYIASSILFAIYHIANFKNWFSPVLFILALVGLFIGGTIFNLLDDKDNTFLNSWFVHICADLAIVLIGFIIFV